MSILKSNIVKSNEYLYPPEFDENDKLEFDRLWDEASIIHKSIFDTEPFIIRLAIIGHIRTNKGLKEPFNNEDLENLKEQYKLKQKIFECNPDDEPLLYDKKKNPIFFPEEYFAHQTENNSNVVIDKEEIECQ